MSVGVFLLMTLGVEDTQATVALFLAVTGLGLGLIMPTATLAVQNTVGKEMLGVATSGTQFIRSLGSTVGTAVIGSIVTKGYAETLAADAPAQAPSRLVSALENPQALVSAGARAALDRAAEAFPGGEQIVAATVDVAREALAASVHDGFVFVLFSTLAAIGAALIMPNLRLEERPVPGRDAAEASSAAPIPESVARKP